MEKAETVIVTVFALAMAYFLVGSVLAEEVRQLRGKRR